MTTIWKRKVLGGGVRYWICVFVALVTLPNVEGAVSEWVETIRSVGPEGAGNVAAGEAWGRLSESDGDVIPEILAGMDGANPLAANYLRSAVEVIASRGGISTEAVRRFLEDTSQGVRARELAFLLIERVDENAAAAMVPGFASDPSTVLRRKAVALLMEGATEAREAGDDAEALAGYEAALDAARDIDQIQEIATAMEELGEPVDLPERFGFLMYWNVVGPFDNRDKVGFDAVYGPEEGVDLTATYEGKEESEVVWEEHETADSAGLVDINKVYGMEKGAVAYAYTEFESLEAQDVELRLGCKNAWKVWVNGEFIFGRDEYHRGMRIDQYRMPVRLEAGTNSILIKVCQDEQDRDWTVQWQFQMRVCDETGKAVHSTRRRATPEPEEKRRDREGVSN
ncbi:MAG: hypothetical protein AAGD22_15355 [Verrucomicrobiota bacterium]